MTLIGIAFRNVFRNKLRTTLTILGVAVSVIAFVFLRTIIDSWTAQADQHSQSRILTRHKVSFVMTMPRRYVEQVKNVPKVKIASAGVWFGLKDPTRENEFFPSGAEDDLVLDRYGKDVAVSPDQRTAWLQNRQGLAVGRATAQKLGWKIGDKVTLVSRDWPNPAGGWSFTVEAIWTSPTGGWDEKWVYAHYEYLNEFLPPARRDRVQWIVSAMEDPRSATEVAATIDRMFETNELATISQDEKTFTKGFLAAMSAVLRAANIISMVILVIMGLVVGNTIAMGVRERTTEYGVLRALGFPSSTIVVFIVGESIFTALVGALIGLGIAWPLINFGMGPNIMREMGNFFAYFRVPISAVVGAVGLAVTIGILASALPTLRVLRLRAVDALRQVA
jgi:putative ABC transport system permease protein